MHKTLINFLKESLAGKSNQTAVDKSNKFPKQIGLINN
jgi:hypothetical protein